MRFLDTMSLHMAVSGLTGFQRTLWMANKLGRRRGPQEAKQNTQKVGWKKKEPGVSGSDALVFRVRVRARGECL